MGSVAKVELSSGETLREAPLPPSPVGAASHAPLIFRGDQLVELTFSEVVSRFDDQTGTRAELQLLVLSSEGRGCYEIETGRRRWRRGQGSHLGDPMPGYLDRGEERWSVAAFSPDDFDRLDVTEACADGLVAGLGGAT